jgi:hypothetical protein
MCYVFSWYCVLGLWLFIFVVINESAYEEKMESAMLECEGA